MAQYKLKTVPTDSDVLDFLNQLGGDRQRRDSIALIDIMQTITGQPPVLWGTAIIGFGTYHYKYPSGHEGDMPQIAFSPRKGKLVLYITNDATRYESIRERLGKHKISKACVYINTLNDVDMNVLEEFIQAAYKDTPA